MKQKIYILSGMLTLLALAACLRQQGATVGQAEPPTEVTNIVTIEPMESTTVTEPDTEPITEDITEPAPISLGEFRLTAYCSCTKCCGKWGANRGEEVVGAIGKVLTAGYSIAVDPTVIPYGSIVVINGKEYEAMDCGGAIKKNRIDIYFNSHEEALEFGVQYAEVYLVEEVQ